MRSAKNWVIAAVLLWMAGACQLGLAYQISLGGAAPDFWLVVLVTLSLFATRRGGATIGFVAGLILGAIAGGHMAAYSITRTVLGFLVGWVAALEFEGNAVVAAIVVASATVCAQLTFLLLAPRGAIVTFLLATIGSAMYNGVLAIPLYALLKRVLDSSRN